MVSAEDAVHLCELLEQHHIRFWVMGGWGVDALLHRQTRTHKDLDILALLGNLPQLQMLFAEQGFILKLVWEENRWVDMDGAPDRLPTAFVVADAQGREIDVHIIDIGADGAIIQHYDSPWPLPNALTGQGSIAGTAITCVSRETQIAMHTGYTLPEAHLRDLELLQAGSNTSL